jgi:RHS repeat-associated protein
MRKYTIPQSMSVEYLLTDHLGSTSLTTDSSGASVSELRYTPFGEIRYSWTANLSTTLPYTPTRYTFTGQYSYMDDPAPSARQGFGLMFYVSRWYDPSLGRFVQADTLIPESTQGTQAWDRYAYVNNSPVNYTDPSGHCSKSVNYEEGTLCYFQNMSWSERKAWLINFAKRNNLGNWFDDMISAVDFMMNDRSLSAEDGIAEVMDAAVLQAVNDGWLIHTKQDPFGGGGQGWADFFKGIEAFDIGDIDKNQLIVIRLQAEQKGVDYSWSLAEVQEAYANSTALDQIYFDVFKWGADSYRSFAVGFRSNPLAVSLAEIGRSDLLLAGTDPRTSGPILNTMGSFGYPAALFLWGQSRTPLSPYP